MASISISLGKPKIDGSRRVYLILAHNQKFKRIPTEYMATKSEYSGNTIKNRLLLVQINSIVLQYEEVIAKYAPILKGMNVEEVYKAIVSVINGVEEEEEYEAEFKLDFIEFYKKFAEKKNGGTRKSYECSMNNLLAYLNTTGKTGIDINELTKTWVMRYVEWMRMRETGDRGIELYIANHRAVHNEAKRIYNDSDDDEQKIKRSPFESAMREVRIPTAKKSLIVKRALPATTIKYMYDMPSTGLERVDNARDAFLLSFCLCGMNSADMHAIEELDSEGRVNYYRQKTRERSGEMSHIVVDIPKVIKPIHEKHLSKRPANHRVWDWFSHYVDKGTFSAGLNKGLKVLARRMAEKYADENNMSVEQAYEALQLPTDLQFYAARHSWATIASNDCNIPIEVVDQALCHAGNTVAERSYIKRDFTKVNEANAKVMEFVFGKKKK